jgi:hypothetical protein
VGQVRQVTLPRSVRVVAASLVLGLAAALLVAVSPSPALAGLGHHGQHDKKRKKGKVVWDSTSFYAGSGAVAAHGKVPGGKKKVKLQVKLPGGWHTFASTKSSRKGTFSIAGTLNWYGSHKVRVSTSGRHRFNRSTKVNVFYTYAPRGNPADHVFLNHQGVRYSFNPCKTVRYAVNGDDVGPFGVLFAQMVMAQTSMATGIPVRYVGLSHQIPFQTDETRLPGNQDLLIAFADETEMPDFVTRSALGFGGPVQLRPARDGRHRRVWEATQSAVVFDTNKWYGTDLEQAFVGKKPLWGEVMLHEFGHAFGLDHSNGPDQIMYWQAGNGVYPDGYFRALYGAGDLAGLATDGLGQGCFRRVTRFRDGAPARIAAPRPLP